MSFHLEAKIKLEYYVCPKKRHASLTVHNF